MTNLEDKAVRATFELEVETLYDESLKTRRRVLADDIYKLAHYVANFIQSHVSPYEQNLPADVRARN